MMSYDDTQTNDIANAEKSKGRMQSDLEEISMEYERTHAAAIITEKRGRNFDKVSRRAKFIFLRRNKTKI